MKADKTVKLEQKITELEDKWKRAIADYHNLEKRVTSQQADFIKFANAPLISRLLNIVDDLKRAANHLNDQGLKLIISQLQDLLETEGVTEIDATGKTFDAHTMEAIETVAGSENEVIEVLATGYKLNDKILRPAKVKVGKGGK